MLIIIDIPFHVFRQNRIFMSDANDSMSDDVCEDLTLIYTKLDRLVERKNQLIVEQQLANARLADAEEEAFRYQEQAEELLVKCKVRTD